MEINDRKKEIAQYIGKKILDLRKSQKLSLKVCSINIY